MFKYPITITLDTNYFESTKYDLTEDSTLRLLQSYVKDGKIKVVLSDIVVREVEAHFKRYVKEMMEAIKASRKEYLEKIRKELWLDAGADNYIYIPKGDDYADKMMEIFRQYLKDIDAEIIETEAVNIQEILDDYFSFGAPFENTEKKRKEFPDAFIASQIRASFPELDSLVIISNDNGFKKACNKNGEYVCFKSLGDLYNAISKENALYNKIIEMLKSKEAEINGIVKKEIEDSDNITVYGQSYDRKGVVYGHEYSETYLKSIKKMTHHLHIVEDIDGDEAIVTLVGHCNIDMDCYYEDYDNAPWDGEIKEYVYVNTVHVLEKHHPNFAFRIRININTGEIKLLPLHLYLGGDSRKEVIELVDDDDDYDEYDLINEERQDLGFQKLDSYYDFVEENLREHEMNKEIIKLLNDYKEDMSILEDVSSSADDYLDQYNKGNSEIKVTMLEKLQTSLANAKFQYIKLPETYAETDVLRWLDSVFEKSEVYDNICIPDEIELNSNYSFEGLEDCLKISIDDFTTSCLSEGDKEWIDINAYTTNGEKASGIIEVTVGYLNFDEDGAAADGIDDEVSIRYTNIVDCIKKFIASQNEILKEYEKLKDIILDSLQE